MPYPFPDKNTSFDQRVFSALKKIYILLHRPFEVLTNVIAVRINRPPPHIRYGFAILAIAVTWIVRLILIPTLGSQSILAIFIIPILISALYGGLGAGILATILGLFTYEYFFVSPDLAAVLKDPNNLLRISIFLIEGVLISTLAEAVQSYSRRIIITLESIGDAFLSFNTNWQVTYINKRAERFISTHRDKVLHKPILEAFPRLKGTSILRKYYQAMQTGNTMHFETFYPPHDRWYDIRLYPSQNGLSVYFQDITKRREIENKKDEFISIASHELKTPLSTVKTYVQILKKQFEKSKNLRVSYFLNNIDEQLNKTTALIGDLLDVSKIKAGKLKLSKKEFDFDKLVKKVVIDFQYISDTHQIEKIGETNKIIYGDEHRIEQVIINLLSNAMKYSPENEKIIVESSARKNDVRLSVQDFGIGIPKNKQSQIFNRFYQVEEHRQGRPLGFGLGLYIASDIIKRHGGKIWVDSTPGKGSTFTFTLPIRRQTVKRQNN